VNVRSVFGKPDVLFRAKRLAIFVDSEFWHGKDYPNGRNIPTQNNEYWVNKIERNIKRDKEVNKELRKGGWKVIRIWSNDLSKNLKKIGDKIEKIVKSP
jgi:DNA mismatch endonuclease Vsr